MSSDDQVYSPDNQKLTIEQYAERNGFVVVRTYEDSGKSGLHAHERKSFRRLIDDVLNGKADFKAILVLDVTRWGRFQNTDEAAYYEFICASAGIPVHYCGEIFPNDLSLSSSLLKSLKRSMAAEFSRELAIKVYQGKQRIARMGFWVGGFAPQGYRRLMLSATGKPKQLMKWGEQKNCTTDRVVLVLGPKREQKSIQALFGMAKTGEYTCTEIAGELNARGYALHGRPWNNRSVRNTLVNPVYAGTNVWGRRSSKLRSRVIWTQNSNWIMKQHAFPAIVDQETFDQAQEAIPKGSDSLWSEGEIITCLRRLLRAKGRLSESIIFEARGTPAISTIHRHLGSYAEIYKKVGFDYEPLDIFKGDQSVKSNRLRRQIVKQICDLFPSAVVVTHLEGHQRSILRVDNRFYVALLVCRLRRKRGRSYWEVEPARTEEEFITLVATMKEARDGIREFHLVPRTGFRSHRLQNDDSWLKSGFHLKNLSEFYEAAVKLHCSRKLYPIAS